MLCCKCGIGLPLIEFGWIRLKEYRTAGKGREIVKGKIWEPKIVYGQWRTYCKKCANITLNQQKETK